MLDELEKQYGKITLWEWVREWIELENACDEDERTPLEEYLYLRAGNQDEVDASPAEPQP